jgi:hypothetical protein
MAFAKPRAGARPGRSSVSIRDRRAGYARDEAACVLPGSREALQTAFANWCQGSVV